MLLPASDSATWHQQRAEGPQQRDCPFACFCHDRAPDGTTPAVDGSALGQQGQSRGGTGHSLRRLVDATILAHSAAETLSRKRPQTRLFACVSSGGVARPAWFAVV